MRRIALPDVAIAGLVLLGVFAASRPNGFSIMANGGRRYITFSFLDALTDAGGTRSINMAMVRPALGMLGWMSRRRKKQSAR
jgi:hypothetical protein